MIKCEPIDDNWLLRGIRMSYSRNIDRLQESGSFITQQYRMKMVDAKDYPIEQKDYIAVVRVKDLWAEKEYILSKEKISPVVALFKLYLIHNGGQTNGS